MRSRNEQQYPGIDSSAPERELLLLSAIEENPQVAQRQLSQRIGIALGLTNVMVRNLAQKGYVRVTQTSPKRWFYSLTPKGFSYKIRLTVAYIHRVLDHYQNVRQTLREELEPLALNQESSVALYGTGEFAELVYLGLREVGIEEIDIFGPTSVAGQRFLGLAVRDISTLESSRYDRIVIAILSGPDQAQAGLEHWGAEESKLVTFFSNGHAKVATR